MSQEKTTPAYRRQDREHLWQQKASTLGELLEGQIPMFWESLKIREEITSYGYLWNQTDKENIHELSEKKNLEWVGKIGKIEDHLQRDNKEADITWPFPSPVSLTW